MTTVLVVDDDAAIRGVLQIGLGKAGYDVVPARNGVEALQLWREKTADLVITDLHMPDKNGLEVILELMASSPKPRIIAMSDGGRTKQKELLGDARLLGAVLTIEKPFMLDDLMALINRALSSRP